MKESHKKWQRSEVPSRLLEVGEAEANPGSESHSWLGTQHAFLRIVDGVGWELWNRLLVCRKDCTVFIEGFRCLEGVDAARNQCSSSEIPERTNNSTCTVAEDEFSWWIESKLDTPVRWRKLFHGQRKKLSQPKNLWNYSRSNMWKKAQIELRWVLSGEKESAIGEKARKENYYKKSKKVNPDQVRTYDLTLPSTEPFRWAKWPYHALWREKVEYITVSVESFFKYGTRSQQK